MLDNFSVPIECPLCGFQNDIFFKQARLRDVVICRGCKRNIQLDDLMNECPKATRQVRRALREFKESLGTMRIEL